MDLRLSDDVRALTGRLLAHFGRAEGQRLDPGAWVLGEWAFVPAAGAHDRAGRPGGRGPGHVPGTASHRACGGGAVP